MKTSIVLSGGGARGIAFRDFKGIRRIWSVPSHISGTSAGAITGAFMQQVTRYQRLSTYWKGRIFNFSNILIKRQGLFAMKGFHDIYKNFSPPILLGPQDTIIRDRYWYFKRRVGLLFVRKSIPIVNGFFLYTYVVPTCTVQGHLVCGRRY
jgi:hypothetical protein